MNQTEKLGVKVQNPELRIVIEGGAFADLVLLEYLRAENLRRCVAAVGGENQDGANELLSEVQIQLQAMAQSSAGVLQECLRVARAQGLVFEIVGDHSRH